MIIVGVVGYIETPRSLRRMKSVWAEHLSEDCMSILYKNWYKAKKKAFTNASKKWQDELGQKTIDKDFKKIVRYYKAIRVIAHTQIKLLKKRQKKAHILESQ
ncbi:hypothetical protein PR048_015302 [Dryococelus australis]|uniref:Ribosomal protein L14 n=1 Tax=Dryococelus australis TaxID=614101 RepID=A0ABQ9HGK1_9NEOP|nr:hypothetical protein PR048_015302 [Dryococelus australis]